MIRPSPTAASRRALLLGTALAALAALPGTAHAQAFNGTPATQGGGVTYNRATPGIETITVNTPQAVISWTVNATGDFLPSGRTATFQGAAGNPNYAVLNRIFPNPSAGGTGPITLDGTIIGRISATDATRGGTIAFYTPNGLVIGGNALIDVGSLILTTLDPVFTTAGQFISPAGSIEFQANPNSPTASITTLAGSQITANQPGSYVIFAAPGITHGGSVRVNGSAAYAAVGGAVITHNAGAFDIQVTLGTTVDTPLVHTGTTGGPASTGAADAHNIVMRAVSDNEAITALIGGQVGYDAPLSAAIENGAIVISTQVGGSGPLDAQRAELRINGGNFTSDVLAESSHDASVRGNVSFTEDLTLAGPREVRVTSAGAAEPISVGGNLLVTSESSVANHPGIDRVGGDVRVTATEGGSIRVAGNADVRADGIGRLARVGALIGNGTGGTAEVVVDAAAIQVGGNLVVSADGATEQVAPIIPTGGGIALGGNARLAALNAGQVTVGGTMRTTANGTAATTSGGGPTAPTGTGGRASIEALSGNVDITGASTISAFGLGGDLIGGGTTGGTGTGGITNLTADNAGQIELTGGLTIDARGVGGLGPAGGVGQGGGATIFAGNGGRVRSLAATAVDVSGIGRAAAGTSRDGGAGTGGTIFARAINGPDDSGAVELGAAQLLAPGIGGAGGPGSGGPSPLVPGAGGNAQGGTIELSTNAEGGTLTTGALRADARGLGGAGGTGAAGQAAGAGGNAVGGDVTAGTRLPEGGPPLVGRATFGAIELDSAAIGGAGGTGGTATGGNATLANLGGAAVAVSGSASLVASATGGDGRTGGAGTGGTAAIDATVGTITIANGATLNARGTGGNIDAAGTVAGVGQGGTARVQANSAATQVNVTGAIGLDASGRGGFSTNATAMTGQTGGAGRGGVTLIQAGAGGGIAATGNVTASSDGFGGVAGTAGAGTGGTATLSAIDAGSTVTLANAMLSADGQAAAAGPAASALDGGNSAGGTATALAQTGGAIRIGTSGGGSLTVTARGLQGVAYTNAVGAAAQGGTARVDAIGGTIQTGLDAQADTSAFAGAGAVTGGAATGGTAALFASTAGAINAGGNALAGANAVGGAGAANGGEGRGGAASLRGDGGTITAPTGSVISATGTGGAGANGAAGFGGAAELFAANGAALALGPTRLGADGAGGVGTANGGLGQGGNVQITSGSAMQLGSLTVEASGFGANATGPGGRGGDGQGGNVALNVNPGGALDVAGASAIDVLGRGGGGAIGGNATGGAINATVAAAATRLAFAGPLAVSASAGSSSPGTTGNAGMITILADGATSFGPVTLTANSNLASNGSGGTITVGGASPITYGTAIVTAIGLGAGATAGGIQLSNMAGAPGASNLTASTNGPLTASNVSATQDIRLTTTAAAALNATNVNAGQVLALNATSGALNATNVRAGGFATFATTTGTLTANGVTGGAAALSTTGGVLNAANVNMTGAVSLTSGTGNLTANNVVGGTNTTATTTSGTLTANNVTAGQVLTLTTTTGALNATTVAGGTNAALTTGSGSLTANGVTGGGVTATTGGGALNASNVNVTGSASFSSGTGNLNAANVVGGTNATATTTGGTLTANNVTAGQMLTLTTTTGALNATTVRGGTNAALTTGLGTLTANGVTGGGATLASGGGVLNASAVNVTGAVSLTSGTGNLTATNVTAGASATLATTSGMLAATGIAGPAIALTTTSGSLSATNLSGQNVAATSATGAVNVTVVSASQSLALATAGTVALAGAVSSPRVTVDSSDIAIAAGANVGGAGSQVTLTVRPNGTQTVLGGTTQGPGYTLDGGEANRIQATNLTLFVPANGAAANRPADLVVRDVTLDAGRLTTLRLQTPGIVQVDGSLLVANAGAANSVTVDGTSPAQRVSFVTPGSIRLRDATGQAAGTLTVDARDIWVADAATIGRLLADRNFAGRDLALLTPSETFAPGGFLEGQNVVLRPAESLYVQNSGTLRAFGGITVGVTLSIQGGINGAPADVTAFGRRSNAAGDLAGIPFFFQVNFGGQFTNGSEFNTCIINPRLCPGGGAGLPGEDIDGTIDGGGGADEGGPGRLPPLFTGGDLISEAALSEPLIEEPVTSGGDSSAWTEQQCSSDPSASGSSDACADGERPIAPPVPNPEQRP